MLPQARTLHGRFRASNINHRTFYLLCLFIYVFYLSFIRILFPNFISKIPIFAFIYLIIIVFVIIIIIIQSIYFFIFLFLKFLFLNNSSKFLFPILNSRFPKFQFFNFQIQFPISKIPIFTFIYLIIIIFVIIIIIPYLFIYFF